MSKLSKSILGTIFITVPVYLVVKVWLGVPIETGIYLVQSFLIWICCYAKLTQLDWEKHR